MRICILTHNEDASAGWGRYSDQITYGLREIGHEVIVLTEKGGAHPFLRRRLGVFWSSGDL